VTAVGEPGRHTLRLFFALWPSAAERKSLADSTADAVSQERVRDLILAAYAETEATAVAASA